MDLTNISLTGLALQAAVVVGLTAVIGKIVDRFLSPPDRDVLMPIIAVGVGVAVVSLGEAAMSSTIYQGIVLGGTVTGLYPIVQSGVRSLSQPKTVIQTVNQPEGDTTMKSSTSPNEEKTEVEVTIAPTEGFKSKDVSPDTP